MFFPCRLCGSAWEECPYRISHLRTTRHPIYWISDVTKILIAVSNADACPPSTRDKLQQHAANLIGVFSSIPEDEESLGLQERDLITETLFMSAMEAHQSDCMKVFMRIHKLMLSWTFKNGRYKTDQGIFEKGVCGLVSIALLSEYDGAENDLKTDMGTMVNNGKIPDQNRRDQEAINLRSVARSLPQASYSSFEIDYCMASVDHKRLRSLLEELADIISPETKGRFEDRNLWV